jgi:hypothetical protein
MGPAPRRAQRRRAAVAAVLTLAAGLACGVATSGCGSTAAAGSDPPPPPSRTVSFTIDPRKPGAAVPRAFAGLSFELTSLPLLDTYSRRGNLVGLLSSLQDGVIRLGGVSADTRVSFPGARPAWADSSLDLSDFDGLLRLSARSGWRILLTLNLAHYDPAGAAAEVAAAQAILGHHLAAIEIGNEADAYDRHGLRSLGWSFSRYTSQVSAYRRAIARETPGIRLAGPDVSGSTVFKQWGPAEASTQHPALLTGHHYPLGCQDTPAPSIAALLSPTVRIGERVSLYRYGMISHAAHIPFRITEAGSVSCGGRPGVSNTFAAALWATDYIAAAMRQGIMGINLHGNLANCQGYAPLCAATPADVADGRLTPQPAWYALLLSHFLVGDHPLASHINRAGANVDAFAFRRPPHQIQVLVVDKEITGGPVAVRIPTNLSRASELWLTAPSAASTSGVTLGGSLVAEDGSWHPTSEPAVANTGGAITVDMPPATAVLLTLS